MNLVPVTHLAPDALTLPSNSIAGMALPFIMRSTTGSTFRTGTVAAAAVIPVILADPSTLKAWVDHIHVPGVTSPFDEATQPLAGRPAVVISARGASYDAGSPSESCDHGSAALKIVLGESLGMEVTVVATSRTLADVVPALGSEAAAREFEAAREQVRELASTL